mmetsp:Transcript_17471/g.38189  ORF Transcript_17471/g.38189 Transcript_17471/m.38189 type:complete len:148 (+) Transcript_17471:85-528(+)
MTVSGYITIEAWEEIADSISHANDDDAAEDGGGEDETDGGEEFIGDLVAKKVGREVCLGTVIEYGYRDDGPAWQVKFEEKIAMMDDDMGTWDTKKILMRTNLRKHWICMKLRVRCWIILKCGQLCMTRDVHIYSYMNASSTSLRVVQ